MNWLPSSRCGGWQNNGETHPPIGHYSEFAPSLAKYAQERLTDPQRSLPAGAELPEWISDNAPALRRGPNFLNMEQWDARQRNRMGVIANDLLPLFEQQPASAWNAVKRLPVGNDAASEHAHARLSSILAFRC